MTWFAGGGARPESDSRAVAMDSVFLALVIILSCLPYVGRLGLYSDDWGFIGSLYHAGGSYRDLVASLMVAMETRPVQAFVIAGLYWLFGLHTFWYHVANCIALAAIVVLFYLSLRTLGVARLVALAVPLVFGLLPHYSTDRFWIAAFQANTSVLLYFISLYADLRFVRGAAPPRWLWKALAAVALMGSVLAYEVTAALFLVNVAVLLYVARLWRSGTVRRLLPTALGVGSNLLFLVLAIGYKMTTTARAEVAGGLRFRAIRIVTEAAPVHFGEYGLGLPLRVTRALRDYPDTLVIGVSVLVGLLVGGYVLRVTRVPAPQSPRGPGWPAVMLVGGVLFVAGYAVSLMTWEIGFHATGPNNRTAIGATIGVAWVFVGAAGWLASRLPPAASARAFAMVIGLLAATGTLLTGTVAGFWVEASRQQETHIASLRERLPELPPGTTLLLDGICPYVGPAPVFATDWDMEGMLRLVYDDPSLTGDVVKPNTAVTSDGVRTLLFDDWINLYPYADDLVVYHAGTNEAYTLATQDQARRYFEGISGPARPACPPYTDGDGVEIF